MYYKFFGLEKNPFDIHPDPKFLYLSDKHREALSHLTYCVLMQKPFLMLTGDVGVGKTTILNYFIASLRKKNNILVIPFLNPRLSLEEFYAVLAAELKIPQANKKAHFLLSFRQILHKLVEKGRTLVLIFDECQAASVELLEELRLISNLAEGGKGLIIILVGQPELENKLECAELYALKQRITYKYHLGPFESPEDVSQYLITRILRAGSPKTKIFTEGAIELIYRYSKGVPRLINILADHSLLTAYLKEQAVVDEDVVKECLPEVRHLLEDIPLKGSPNTRLAPKIGKKWLLIIILILSIIILLWFYRHQIPLGEEFFG